MRLPLEDVKVLDLSHALAGPFCSTMLADFGAEVIKLEPKDTGDIARAWGPALPGGETSYFVSLHRNKKGIEVDLKHAEGKELFFRLMERVRRRARELPGRRPRPARPRLRGGRRAESRHHLLLRLGLRPGRAVPGPGRARPDPPGGERDDQRDRRGGRARRALRRLHRRHDRGDVRRLRHHARAPRQGAHRPRPVHRRVHAGGPALAPRPDGRRPTWRTASTRSPWAPPTRRSCRTRPSAPRPATSRWPWAARSSGRPSARPSAVRSWRATRAIAPMPTGRATATPSSPSSRRSS